MTAARTQHCMPLGRRRLLAGAAGLAACTAAGGRAAGAAAPPPGVPSDGRLLFDVFREDSRIGTHSVTFHHTAGGLTVHIAADFRVGFGPLTLFRYSLRTTEQWQAGELVSAVSQADDNGTAESMSAKRQGNALAVTGTKSGHYIAPPGSILGTHWNRDELKAPMINPENGALMRFSVIDKGPADITADGKPVTATRYALSGPATIDLWYSQRSVWSALQAVATDGSLIQYRLA